MIVKPIFYRIFFFTQYVFLILLLGAINPAKAQVISTDPAIPVHDQPLTIYLNINEAGAEEFAGYTGDIYAHTGVNNWQYVIGDWNINTSQPKLTRLSDTQYKLEITPSIRQFYSVPGSVDITRIAVVFRSADRSKQTRPDIFINVYEAGLNVSIVEPAQKSNILEFGDNLTIRAAAIQSTSLSLYVDDSQVATTTAEEELSYVFNSTSFGYGSFWIIAKATDGEVEVSDSTYIFVRNDPVVANLPTGVIPGINYIDDVTVTLVLQDPPATKSYAFTIGDFNDWSINQDGYMNTTPDGRYFWITLTDLTPGKEYGFQYFVDGSIRIADPYTEKVLDPWNDDEIRNQGRYPGLIPYPKGKTDHPASVFQTAQQPFEWTVTDFTPPATEDLVIYELLIRDFLANSTYKQLKDTLAYLQRLGINAIELMPVNNFEGNLSWGYNPSFYFAPDKYYGPRQELKKFIDEAHRLGMAVILDMVWNHSFGQSPLLRLYFDDTNNRPASDNPWYSNLIFANPGMNFGYKFDHGSPHFIEFMDRANRYWLEEYKIDGFRFDLTKGFTTRFKGSNDEWGSNYDQERVDNLTRMYNQIRQVNPKAYVILEHLADNAEETVLANNGMMLWGNLTHAYQEASMGWLPSSNFNWINYKSRNWNSPHLVGYMESHDEERIMFKNITYGNSGNPEHDVKQLPIALQRAGLVAAFYFPIPGPKMIWQFGELGYDYSINHCPNGTLDGGCRTSPKPVRWDYYQNPDRKRLYDIYSLLINLKKEHEVFRTTDFTLSLGGAGKRIHLSHPSNNVTVIGNFGIADIDINPNFQQTGQWNEYFTRRRITINDVNQTITLKPGEYRLYSTTAFPDHGLSDLFDGESYPFDAVEEKVIVAPNPSMDNFVFALKAEENHHIRIFDLRGNLVFESKDAFDDANSYFEWDGRLPDGTKASNGIYFYNIFSQNSSFNGKIIVFSNR